MPMLARGAALVDSSGALVTAEAGFLRSLALPAVDPAEAWRVRASQEAGLPGFLRGEGSAALTLLGAGGAALTLERLPTPGGLLLVLRSAADDARLEHVARSRALPLLAGGLSHDVAGPLNTVTLQLALLGEKLDGGPAARHLGVLREQVGRVDRVVRRFRELVDPPSPLGGLDLAALAVEVAALFAHDLQRRSAKLDVEPAAGPVRTGVPADRATLLVLGLVARAVAATPDAGSLSLAAGLAEGWATLTLDHAVASPGLDLDDAAEVAAAAAAALGGRLERATQEGRERMTLQLPRGGTT
jgi:hypothetical protein